MFKINNEDEADGWEVETLLGTCFGDARFGLSSYQLRVDCEPVSRLCFVARDENNILAGVIRFWDVSVGGETCLLLGPIGVHPTRQGEGLGALLMHRGISEAKNMGWGHILLIGDLSYYARFGFSRIKTPIDYPQPTDPRRILGMSFYDDNLHFKPSGKVTKRGLGKF